MSAPAPGLACVSVDLDSLHHYYRIHGLPEAGLPEEGRRLIYERALPRFVALFTQLKLPATLFAIGEDVAQGWARPALEQAVRAGLEIGNHSHTHPYDLSRRAPEAIGAELDQAHRAIERVTGTAPSGFRAPGYTLSAPLYASLAERGYRYDSSTFPATPYYLAKAAVMAGMALMGRRSGAVLDRPGVLFAPRQPYLPDPKDPYRAGSGPVLELPISVSAWTRLPLIGTFAVMAPLGVVRRQVRGLNSQFLNFELHGVDLLDEDDGIPVSLVDAQPDLKIAWRTKLERLTQVIAWIQEGHRCVRLAQAAQELTAAAAPQAA